MAAAGAKRAKGAAGAGEAGAAGEGAIAVWTQRAKGIGLLVGFAIAFLVSRGEGLPLADAALRGVVGALAMSVVCWWCSLMVITGLIRSALHRQNEEYAAAVRAVTEAHAQQAGATVDALDDEFRAP